jgi:hypothetical protein
MQLDLSGGAAYLPPTQIEKFSWRPGDVSMARG